MKRFVVAALSLFALSLPLTAEATPQLKTIQVDWQQRSTSFVNLISDSASMKTGRAVGTIQQADTSSVINIRQFIVPQGDFGDGGAAVDSISWMRIDVFPTAAHQAITADSLFLTIQVSNDGVASWVAATPTILFAGETGAGGIILEQGSTNAFYLNIEQVTLLGSVLSLQFSSSTAPTWLQLYGWPYMRIICQGDFTGRYDAKITGFVPGVYTPD